MARYLFGGPPLVHHEDGFNQDEAEGLKPGRNLYRRLGLGGAPAGRAVAAAGDRAAPPGGSRRSGSSGSPTASRRPLTLRSGGRGHPGLASRSGRARDRHVAGLRPVKNLPRLVRAFAAMRNKNARLVIVGEGPESERIIGRSARLGVADRCCCPASCRSGALYRRSTSSRCPPTASSSRSRWSRRWRRGCRSSRPPSATFRRWCPPTTGR
jgi:hypothetical protein